jgi:hypothetical protein
MLYTWNEPPVSYVGVGDIQTLVSQIPFPLAHTPQYLPRAKYLCPLLSGIHRWISNSIVVHAVSDGPPDWNFERKEQVVSLFSHEPIVARAPTGDFVLYFTAYDGAASDEATCNCTDGSSHSGEQDGCEHEVGPGKHKSLYTYFTSSATPYGPWSSPTSLAGAPIETNPTVEPPGAHMDLNFSPVIAADGSLRAWTRSEIWTASDWKDASTYTNAGQAPDFDNGGQWEGEDPVSSGAAAHIPYDLGVYFSAT